MMQALEDSASLIESHSPDFQGLSVCALPATDVVEPWLSPTTGVATVSVTECPEVIHELLCKSGRSVGDTLEKQKIVAAGATCSTCSPSLISTQHRQDFHAVFVRDYVYLCSFVRYVCELLSRRFDIVISGIAHFPSTLPVGMFFTT